MVVDEQVQASGVAAPHLEPVEGTQRLVHREERLDRPLVSRVAGQPGDALGGPDPVAGDGPHAVAHPDQLVVAALEVGGGKLGTGLHGRFDGLDRRLDLSAVMDEGRGHGGILEQEADTGDAAQQRIDRGQLVGCDPKRPRDVVGIAQRRRQSCERADDLDSGRHRSSRGPPDDGDDPAHVLVSRRKGSVPVG